MTANQKKLGVIAIFIAAFAIIRLLPHPANFTPIGAIAIFAGAKLGKKALAFILPLLALVVTDLMLSSAFYDGFLWVYGGIGLIVFVGRWIKSNTNPISIIIAAFGSALVFFIVSNLGVWITSSFYPKSIDGLVLCYERAIPFFRNDLLGNLVFSFLIFGAYDLVKNLVPSYELD